MNTTSLLTYIKSHDRSKKANFEFHLKEMHAYMQRNKESGNVISEDLAKAMVLIEEKKNVISILKDQQDKAEEEWKSTNAK